MSNFHAKQTISFQAEKPAFLQRLQGILPPEPTLSDKLMTSSYQHRLEEDVRDSQDLPQVVVEQGITRMEADAFLGVTARKEANSSAERKSNNEPFSSKRSTIVMCSTSRKPRSKKLNMNKMAEEDDQKEGDLHSQSLHITKHTLSVIKKKRNSANSLLSFYTD